MENVTLKKKLSTYVSDSGYLKNVSDDVLYEVLLAWEQWTGTGADFYRSLGFTYRQMASLVGKAKKLKREGHFGTPGFKQVQVEGQNEASVGPCIGAEVVWGDGRVIAYAKPRAYATAICHGQIHKRSPKNRELMAS